MSQPKYIPVVKRFIQYIVSKNLNDVDIQNDKKIQKLLQHAFENNKVPNEEHVQSVKALFQKTTIGDFMRHLYRYSELISTYLWVDRVQEIVTDPKDKSRILRGHPINPKGYKLYCYLKGINYLKIPVRDLTKNHEVNLFRNILRCAKELSEGLEAFIKDHFQEDFSEEEKNDITLCTRKFL